MKRNILLALLFPLLALTACSQTTPPHYIDFVLANNRLLVLTADGQLQVFDLNQPERHSNLFFEDSVVAISKDIHSDFVVGDRHHRVQKYDTGGRSWTLLGSYSGTLYGITFDHSNTCYVITSRGVVELGTKQSYLPDSGLNSQIHYNGTWFRQPIYYMDAQDNLWVGFKYGEWGGDLFVFSTRLRRFLPLKMNGFSIELNPIQGICSNGIDAFIATGMDHMMTTSGSIIRLRNYEASVIFDSSPYSAANQNDKSFVGEYIGPTSFNSADHYLYFYSNHGFFRGDPDKGLSSIEKWEKVAQPNLKWSWGQMDAVGSPMNVRKIAFYRDSQLLFLTQLNGIGILQDGNAVFLK